MFARRKVKCVVDLLALRVRRVKFVSMTHKILAIPIMAVPIVWASAN
jgi:hypothetical protein